MLMDSPDASKPNLELVTGQSPQIPQPFKALDAKTLQNLPDLHKEAELDKLAKEINHAHAEIESHSREFVRMGMKIVERAIICGRWLRTVKAGVGHGNFEPWCKQNLDFSLRKAQYYMLLDQRHAAKDILKLNPQSLRQAFIYAGALPEDTDKKHPSGNFDELAHVRKTIARLLLELKANQAHYPEELLKATEPLVQWRNQLVARGSQEEKPAIVVDVEAQVEPDVGGKNAS